MRTNSKQMLPERGKIAYRNLLTVFLSLALIISSCTDTEDSIPTGGTPLQVTVSNDLLQSRTIVEGNTLPADAIMGVSVVAANGSAYPTGTYTNLKYTTTDGATFDTTDKPMLTSDEAKAVAYYPYSSTVSDMTAIPVTTAEQKDYMYSEWYSGLTESSPVAKFEMKHALAAIRINLQKSAGYATDASVTSVKAVSDAFHASATLDATTGSLSARTGKADLQNASLNQTLSTSPYAVDFLVVPGTSAATITFTATIGGKEYIATTPAAVTLQQGAIHSFTLTLSAQDFSVTNTTVKPWTTLDKGSLTLEKYVPNVSKVYAVKADGSLIDYTTADNTCVGVALHVTGKNFEHKFMIAKSYATNDVGHRTLYWGKNLKEEDITSIVTNGKVDGTNKRGYLPKPDGTYEYTPNLSSDFTTWTAGGLSDFNGKDNTAGIINAYTEQGVSMDVRDMCSALNTFNASDSHNDWYVPACGQLALMYLAKTEIEAALAKIGGTALDDEIYFSSSENYINSSWSVNFKNGNVNIMSKKTNCRVWFVRDI